MTEANQLEDQVWTVFEDELGLQPPAADTDLFTSGIMDSLTFVNLLMCIERKFGLSVKLESLELENFQSITRIAQFISRSGAGEVRAADPARNKDDAQSKRAAG